MSAMRYNAPPWECDKSLVFWELEPRVLEKCVMRYGTGGSRESPVPAPGWFWAQAQSCLKVFARTAKVFPHGPSYFLCIWALNQHKINIRLCIQPCIRRESYIFKHNIFLAW